MTREFSKPQCSVFIAVSVDGYIARKDGAVDWLSIVEKPGEDYGYKTFAETVDVIVMGRNTYDSVLGFPEWPYGKKRLVVLTHRPEQPRHNEEFFSGSPRLLLDKLAREGARRVYVDGGVVIQQFLNEGLIEDLTLSIIPIVLGEGIRLFGEGEAETRLILDEARSFASGLVQLKYSVKQH